MPFLIQHGYGKSDKIEAALSTGAADGVILGPRHELPQNLLDYARQLGEQYSCERYIDPQFFAAAINPANDGRLPEYPYYEPGLAVNQFRLKRIQKAVKDTLDFQCQTDLTALLSPSVLFESLQDRWSQIAVNLADAAVEYHGGLKDAPPLILSFHLSEHVLDDVNELDAFLDNVTQYQDAIQGFYFTVARSELEYSSCYDGNRLSNLMYLVHVLGELNEYDVLVGSADYSGILCRAVGARAFASGWGMQQRRFHRSNFVLRENGGGQQPKPRYSSNPLLTSLFLDVVDRARELEVMTTLLSEVPADEILTASDYVPAKWSKGVAIQQHFQSLKKLDVEIVKRTKSNLRNLTEQIEAAEVLYRNLKRRGVEFDQLTDGQHLADWREAIDGFTRRLGGNS